MIYMQSTIEVLPEEQAAFHAVMKDIVAFQESQGWRLASAFVGFTGPLNTYVDIWEMDDADHFQRGLFGLRAHPDIVRIRAALNRAVIKETLVLGAPAPFLPRR